MKKAMGILFYVLISASLFGQTDSGKYLIWFRDKAHNSFSLNDPRKFLSERAIERRIRYNIPYSGQDLPVTRSYVDSLKRLGIRIVNTSKWFNNATVAISDTSVFGILRKISFLDFSKTTLTAPFQLNHKKSFALQEFMPGESDAPADSMYGLSYRQIELVNGQILHQMGLRGEGIQIAILDAGYSNADKLPVFDSLWLNNRILGSYDYVTGNSQVFGIHPHGTYVLSILGGNIPLKFIGTAPDASFWLLRTEDAATEYIIEEDNWVSAAEFADSAGVDIISTSLGYTQFDWPFQNHTYRDMNGRSARISIAADIAFSRGMIVVVSAGNEANKPWRHISAPADAINSLAVGAVDVNGDYASFSSIGPSYDARVKPNVSALGRGSYIAVPDGTFAFGNGTSFSAPVISGLTACLWQAYPQASNQQVKESIEKSCSHYNQPDSLTGFGIADFGKALDILSEIIKESAKDQQSMIVFPNPFHESLSVKITDPTPDQNVRVILTDLSGRIISSTIEPLVGRIVYEVSVPAAAFVSRGMYIVEVVTSKKKYQTFALKQ